MPIRIVHLGSPRAADEGLRIGTVRRPPRGVPKAEFASRNFYDVWYPELSPEPDLMHAAQEAIKNVHSHDPAQAAQGAQQWKAFDKAFRKQLADATRNAHRLHALGQLARLHAAQTSQRIHHGLFAAQQLGRACIGTKLAVA